MRKFKPNIPTLKYTSDEKKRMISLRVPEPLIEEVQKLAKEKGLTTAFLIETVLDLYCQFERAEQKQNNKRHKNT